MFGGSWYIRTNQPTLSDRKTWNINEAQYLRQTLTSDYVLGSHPTFWRNQGGQFLGVTTVQRFGYTPLETVGSGFSPSQRMQSNQIGRTISGEAAPGTLVQLTLEHTPNTIKISGKMTHYFDKNTYRNLLTEVIPVVIETEEEYDRILKVVEQLTFKKNRTKYGESFT